MPSHIEDYALIGDCHTAALGLVNTAHDLAPHDGPADLRRKS